MMNTTSTATYEMATSRTEGGGPETAGGFLDAGGGAREGGRYTWREIVETAREWGPVIDEQPDRSQLTVEADGERVIIEAHQ